MAWLTAAITVFFLTLISMVRVQAQETAQIQNDQFPPAQEIPSSTIPRFFSGSTVFVEENTGGAALVVGSSVFQNGDVHGDFLAAAGSVIQRGEVHQDVYIAAGTSILQGEITGNVFVVAGEVLIEPTASVSGSVYILAEKVTVEGDIAQELRIYAQEVTLAGTVQDLSTVHARELELTDTAELATISGQVTTTNRSENASISGEFLVTQPPEKPAQNTERTTREHVMRIVRAMSIAAVFGWLVWLITRPFWPGWVAAWQPNWFSITVWGLALGLLWPVLAMLLLVSVFGLPLTVLGTVFWILFLWSGWVLPAIFVAELLPGKGLQLPRWGSVLLTAAVWGGVMALPVIGWVVRLLSGLLGLGMVSRAVWNTLRSAQAEKPRKKSGK